MRGDRLSLILDETVSCWALLNIKNESLEITQEPAFIKNKKNNQQETSTYGDNVTNVWYEKCAKLKVKTITWMKNKQTNKNKTFFQRDQHYLPTSLLLFSLSTDVSTFALVTPLSWLAFRLNIKLLFNFCIN